MRKKIFNSLLCATAYQAPETMKSVIIKENTDLNEPSLLLKTYQNPIRRFDSKDNSFEKTMRTRRKRTHDENTTIRTDDLSKTYSIQPSNLKKIKQFTS